MPVTHCSMTSATPVGPEAGATLKAPVIRLLSPGSLAAELAGDINVSQFPQGLAGRDVV